jgi:hypothetical protein
MKKILTPILFLASALCGASSNAENLSKPLEVSANVERVCYIRAISNVHFNYQAHSTSDMTRYVSSDELLNIKCSGLLYPDLHISKAHNEQREMVGDDGEILKYSLTFSDYTLNEVNVLADDKLINSDGSSVLYGMNSFTFNFVLPKGQYVKAQNYSETITATLSY